MGTGTAEEVFANNTHAIALYTSLGFQEEGRLRGRMKMAPGIYIDTITMGQWVKEKEELRGISGAL